MTIDENLARLRAHRNNVHRYRRLLATHLSDLERAYIERRLSEERASMEALSQESFQLSAAQTWGFCHLGNASVQVSDRGLDRRYSNAVA
jgi:hypothetical protein